MKRGKSEEPFLPAEGNGGGVKSADDILNDEESEQTVMNRIMERRVEWSRNRRNTDDCNVS